MPSWQKIDMFDLPSSLIPYTAVVNVTHDPMDFVYRYWGSGMTEVQEQESTNCSVNDLEPDFISQAIFQAYNDVIHRAEPVYIINTYRNENKLLIEDHFLRLPLSDTGTTVDMVMSIYKTSNSSFKQFRVLIVIVTP